MKRLLAFLLVLALLPTLSGCAGIYANTREVEQLLVIQTMGLDTAEEGVGLSLASGAGIHAAGSPVRLHGAAGSITAAIEQIRNNSNEEDLFCAHIGHVLIGEDAAKAGVDDALSYICRSPDLRISVPVYIAKGGTAEEAVMTVGDSSYGICDALDAVNGDVKLRGDGHIFSAADIVCALERHGSALICAVERVPSAEKKLTSSSDQSQSNGGRSPMSSGQQQQEQSSSQDEPKELYTVAAAGYAVIKDGRLCTYLDREQAVGVGFLIGDVGLSELSVTDRDGNPVTLTIDEGSSQIRPVWGEDGSLEGLDVSVNVGASVSETRGTAAFSDGSYEDLLVARLETALSERIASVLQLSKSLGADFMGLGSQVELADPVRYRALDTPFAELLPQLSVQVSVSGKLTHTHDIRDDSL